jgi:hypothetical protein
VSGVPGRPEPLAARRQADAPGSGTHALAGRWPDNPRQERATTAEAAWPGSPGDWHAALAQALRIGLLDRELAEA